MRKAISLLLCLVLCLSPVLCTATAYQVTEDELTKLERVFSELKSTNAVLMQDSTKSAQDLIKALNLLRESQIELQKLQTQLVALKAESLLAKDDLKQANGELAKVNESFRTYEKEQKAKLNRLRIQNILWIIACGALVVTR